MTKNLNIKPQSVILEKSQSRNNFGFTTKAVKNILSGATVHVILRNQEFSEEFDIPVSAENPDIRR